MIQLTRLSHEPIMVNSDLILFVEANPDTVITTTTGEKLRVRESPAEIADRVVAFRQSIHSRSVEVEAIDPSGRTILLHG